MGESLLTRPELLIENWLPTREIGIEALRERAAASALPPIYFLHVWWARRPLVASAGAILASLLPAWTPQLAEAFPQPELRTETAYRKWLLHLLGIHGDPIAADQAKLAANARGERLRSNPFTYKQAYKNSPTVAELSLLHRVLAHTWGRVPQVADPTAGGGSIPYEAIRYGLPALANDLNPIAVSVLKAGVELAGRHGTDIAPDLRTWGETFCQRLQERLDPFYPRSDKRYVAILFARSVNCPRTGKQVPLAPNWWLDKSKGGTAIKLVTRRDDVELDAPEFEIVRGSAIDKKAVEEGTITRGKAVSPWDDLVIDGDYIKAEAQAGRMGSILYAVAVRGAGGREFRAPTGADLEALRLAEDELALLLPQWEADDVIPDEGIPDGNDMRPVTYGMARWRNMFSPRQLLAQGMFVEEFRRLIPEVRVAVDDPEQADAVLALLALMQGKAVNWNALLSSWDVSRQKMRSVFDRHDFSFKWTYAEFDSARELFPWSLDQVIDAYTGIAQLLQPTPTGELLTSDLNAEVPGPVTVRQGNAGDLHDVSDGSYELVCIDPPYYYNVMYAELADFFYVWEKRTLGRIWPDLFVEELTNKDEEAVANEARFKHAGRRKKELATLDYEQKMTSIFDECRRILTDTGVMTVMFTHKKAEAWDTLGQALLDAGFTIEASWPVPTESPHGLHAAQKNSAQSTIFLTCRKRTSHDAGKVFFETIEGDLRHTTREAYSRFVGAGIDGVDLLLSTYGPALSVLSANWPVYSSQPNEDGSARLLRPDEALDAAREEVVRLQLSRLYATNVEFDALTDAWLVAWQMFQARQFPFDQMRKLAFVIGGMEVADLQRAKILRMASGSVMLEEPKARLRRDADSELPGVHRDRTEFPVLLDALHTALYILDLDGAAAAKTWLERRNLVDDHRFRSLVQGAVLAVPRVKDKGELLVPEAKLLERLVQAAFPDTEIPADPEPIGLQDTFAL